MEEGCNQKTKYTAAIEGERKERLCQVNTSSRLEGSLAFPFLPVYTSKAG